MLTVAVSELGSLVAQFFWPFARIGAVVSVAPIFGAALVPVRIRLVVALALTALIAPVIEVNVDAAPLSLAGAAIVAREVLIGVAMGFTLQMVFDALVVGGQAIAMSMGLGFATMIDPARGVSVPVVSQFFLIVATLVFLALNGHLVLIDTLAAGFSTLPVGGSLERESFWQIALWGSEMFTGALRVALPAMTALLIVNVAFGVMSRAAPTLNLFAVGFPITMGLGFVIIWSSMPNFPHVFEALLTDGFSLMRMLVGLGPIR